MIVDVLRINADGTQTIAQQEFEPSGPPPPPKTTPEQQIEALEQQNSLLQAQIQATSELMDFYEECIVETAMIVYA